MNEYSIATRKRRQNLLIVEGKHEKEELFWLIFRCFPEIEIDMNDVWVYGTNIYVLYEDITKEYDSEWAARGDDIDLPYVISKKQHSDNLCYKEDFTNIILVFDYERHDINFSEEKIQEMQKYFSDAADVGKLYINYPMIESYLHLKALPDNGYAKRKIPVSLQPGRKYKALVKAETVIEQFVKFPNRIDELFCSLFETCDLQKKDKCFDAVLNISNEKNVEEMLQDILQGQIEDTQLKTIKYKLNDWIQKAGYIHTGQTYWKYMREIFKQIVYHNICKANRIQNNQYQIEDTLYKKYFDKLDLCEILRIQNQASQDEQNGFIWVLNTCIFFIAEYNFSLLKNEN